MPRTACPPQLTAPRVRVCGWWLERRRLGAVTVNDHHAAELFSTVGTVVHLAGQDGQLVTEGAFFLDAERLSRTGVDVEVVQDVAADLGSQRRQLAMSTLSSR